MNRQHSTMEQDMRKPIPNETIGKSATTAKPASSGTGNANLKKTVEDTARAAADKAGELAEEAKSVAADAKSAAAETISEAAAEAEAEIHNKASAVHDEAVEWVTGTVEETAESGKSQGHGIASSFGRAFEAAGESLEGDGFPGIAGYARAAGKSLHEAADEIEQLQTTRVTGQIETFMRERPLATAGLFALAGFVVVGALKATQPRHAYNDDDTDIG